MTSAIGFTAYAVLLCLFAIGAWLRPPSAIAALACLFGLKQLGEASHALLAVHAVVTNLAVASVVALAVVRRLMQGKMTEDRKPAVYWLILAFYAYALLSLAWTPALAPALKLWGHDYPYIVLLVFVAPWLAITNAELRTAFGWLTYVGGLLVVALLFTAHWGDRGLLVSSGGGLDEANPLAIADVAGVVAVAALFIVPERLRTLAWLVRLLIAAVCAIAIVRSGSRGQLFAICVSALLMLPIAYRVTGLRSAAGALVAMFVVGSAVAWAVESYVHWWDARWVQSTASGDVTGRWAMALELLNAWSRHATSIIFGIGNSGSFLPSIVGFYPHNVPLEILGEEGMVGFVLYVVLIARVAFAAFGGVRHAGSDLAQRGLLAVTLGCFLFTLIVSLKQGNAIGSVTFFMFSVLACRAAAQVSATHMRTLAATPPNLRQTEVQSAFPNLLR
jgi:hypothetical protein